MATNYKDTLNLPKTDFPMKADLVNREPERLAKWEAEGLYEQIQASRKDAPEFVLHDGPPFANGDVHMGTALNKILKDVIVKSRTMLGFRAPFGHWAPGFTQPSLSSSIIISALTDVAWRSSSSGENTWRRSVNSRHCCT